MRNKILLFLTAALSAIAVYFIQGQLNSLLSGDTLLPALIQAIFISALIEETAKISIFAAIFLKSDLDNKKPLKNYLFAAFTISIGFAFIENILYSMDYAFSVILIRLLTAVPLHLLATGCTAVLLHKARHIHHRQSAKIHYIIALLSGWLIHGLYNTFFTLADFTQDRAASIIFAALSICLLLVTGGFLIFKLKNSSHEYNKETK